MPGQLPLNMRSVLRMTVNETTPVKVPKKVAASSGSKTSFVTPNKAMQITTPSGQVINLKMRVCNYLSFTKYTDACTFFTLAQ